MKLISYLAILIFSASASLSDPITVSSLHKAVAENDFERVEAGLSDAQSAYLAGKRTADDMHDLYIALSRSDPQMVTFVTNWLKNNPKAQIARAWSIYGAAGFVASGRNRFSAEVSQAM